MKKIVLIIAAIAISFVSCKEDATKKIKSENVKTAQARNSTNKGEAPVITFDKIVHDWGQVNEGDKLETTFSFKNTGKSPLIITKIKASCGCTVPSGWSKEPIMPGQSSKFDVKFNTKGKPNNQQKSVTVTCNTAKGSEIVKIKAQVTPDPEQEKIRAKRKADRDKKRAEQQAKKAKQNLVEVKK